ncbi:M14 family zinc carboxypeptidase [Microbacterium testaceum]|uniref:Peptidase M14 domain-containing protein n=1 Tax=Microbacterium testaceum TaxID=2033 RepID=A0A147F9S7_MICTE|nr:M14 family zinc carboxypeptidase [Microbacterium testaceum]KTS13259.1 hypothetical protein RSA3_05430 [Microbacterium testaceum]KTS92079.1 hypothetical protein NS183_01190 [Microbacterium testaceum]
MPSLTLPQPALTGFPTVNALEAAFLALSENAPHLVRRRILGWSRLGEPIPVYAIGDGPKHAVIAGGVHPNEPIGFHTALTLAERLVADEGLRRELGMTFHIVPCIDPDGTRMNEGWFASPGDRGSYGRAFYRPAPDEQVEWSFPLSYKRLHFDRVLPETRALADLFDEVEPALFVGLHNAEVGGVYFYVNRDDDALVRELSAIPAHHGLPLDIGEPESPDLVRLGDAVFRCPTVAERYDYLEGLGLDPLAEVSGGGSADYLQRHGTLVMVAELPYWTHDDVADEGSGGISYRRVVQDRAEALRALGETLGGALSRVEAHLTIPSPMLRGVRAFAPLMTALADAEDERARRLALDRIATRAEVFSNEDAVRSFRLRFGGMLLRALEVECAAGVAHDTVRRERDAFRDVYEEWVAEAERVPLRTLPLTDLVGVQLDAVLAAARAAVTA